jgi:hypothetical protein
VPGVLAVAVDGVVIVRSVAWLVAVVVTVLWVPAVGVV